MSTVPSPRRVTNPRTALPFANGDRMSQPEFHRRYEQCPPGVKAELIGGVVYMASPTGHHHGSRHQELNGPCWLYKANTPGVEVLDNATTILGEGSEPQPDVALRLLPEWGGRSRVSEEEYVLGAPELVAEVAGSTRAIALHRKRSDYEQTGVIEYVVLCLEEQELHWFDFSAKEELQPTRGIHRSRVFPGLWIDAAAVLAGDSQRTIQVIQRGLASKEHAAFVKRLKATHRKFAREG